MNRHVSKKGILVANNEMKKKLSIPDHYRENFPCKGSFALEKRLYNTLLCGRFREVILGGLGFIKKLSGSTYLNYTLTEIKYLSTEKLINYKSPVVLHLLLECAEAGRGLVLLAVRRSLKCVKWLPFSDPTGGLCP